MNTLLANQVLVSLGTNTERDHNMHLALDALADAFGELGLSSVYQSQPVSERLAPADEPIDDYWNLIVSFVWSETKPVNDANVRELLKQLKAIESLCARQNHGVHITMDIDLLCVGDYVGEVADKYLPRPEIEHCAYMLRPLAELFADVQYPGKTASFSQCWEAFSSSCFLQPVDFVWRDQVVSVAPPCLPI